MSFRCHFPSFGNRILTSEKPYSRHRTVYILALVWVLDSIDIPWHTQSSMTDMWRNMFCMRACCPNWGYSHEALQSVQPPALFATERRRGRVWAWGLGIMAFHFQLSWSSTWTINFFFNDGYYSVLFLQRIHDNRTSMVDDFSLFFSQKKHRRLETYRASGTPGSHVDVRDHEAVRPGL